MRLCFDDKVSVGHVWMWAAFRKSWCTRRRCLGRPYKMPQSSAGRLKREVSTHRTNPGGPGGGTLDQLALVNLGASLIWSQLWLNWFHVVSPIRPILSTHSRTQLGDDEVCCQRLHWLTELGLQGGTERQERQLHQCLRRVCWATQNQGKCHSKRQKPLGVLVICTRCGSCDVWMDDLFHV